MQKREHNKLGGNVGGVSSAPPAKRGRPFGSVNSNAAAAVEIFAPSALLGPSFHVHTSFAGLLIETLFTSSLNLRDSLLENQLKVQFSSSYFMLRRLFD